MRRADLALLAIGLLAAGGCNRVFGLLEVEGTGGDDDGTDANEPDDGIRPPTCWSPETIDHDEDMDFIPDGCDTCPADPNGAQLDSDGDGVGDECDPHTSSADRIAFFDGFGETAIASGWTPFQLLGTPTYVIADDALKISAGMNDSLLLERVEPFDRAIVDLRYERVGALQSCGAWVRILFPAMPSDDRVACETNTSGVSVNYVSGNAGFSSYAATGMAQLIAIDAGSCAVSIGGTRAQTTLPSVLTSTTGHVAIHAQGSPMEVYSITVFESPE
jgi:hypothetical protein